MASTIILIRHTPVAVDDGICYGRSDIALADGWAGAFAELQTRLPAAAREPDAVYASPATRCARLAQYLYPEVTFDERLQELDFGRWEGQRWDAIAADELRAWSDDYVGVAPPGGECFGELLTRATACIAQALAGGRQRLVVISHGGVILGLLAQWLGLAPANAFRLQVDYGGISTVYVDGETVRVRHINR